MNSSYTCDDGLPERMAGDASRRSAVAQTATIVGGGEGSSWSWVTRTAAGQCREAPRHVVTECMRSVNRAPRTVRRAGTNARRGASGSCQRRTALLLPAGELMGAGQQTGSNAHLPAFPYPSGTFRICRHSVVDCVDRSGDIAWRHAATITQNTRISR